MAKKMALGWPIRACLSSLFLLALSTTLTAAAEKPQVNGEQCNCFMTNGSNGNYFTNHRFYDFRSLSNYVGDGVPGRYTGDAAGAATASVTSSFFKTKSFKDDWAIMTWNNSGSVGKDNNTYLMVNSASNLYIEANTDHGGVVSDTYLTMRTVRLPDFQTAAELESMSNQYRFLSIRMLARTVGAPGACTALFTYKGSHRIRDVQEADIEILTRDPNRMIQYTNQPSFTQEGNAVEGSSVNATLQKPWTEWAVHRMDWSPKKTTWYVDGQEVTSLEFQVPREASHVNINSWSDGGVWTGAMEIGNEALLQIQWVEMVFNTTAMDKATKRDGSSGGGDTSPFGGSAASAGRKEARTDAAGCRTVCSIDEASVRGLAVVVAEGGAVTNGLRDVRLGGRAPFAVAWFSIAPVWSMMASLVPFMFG